MKGLRTYFDHILPHYEMLEEKYGYQYPDVMWLTANYNEVCRDMSNVQVDGHLIEDRTVLNPQKEEDARLIHLVQFYRNFRYSIAAGFALMTEDSPIEEVQAMMETAFKADKNYTADMEFLTAHKKKQEGQKNE